MADTSEPPAAKGIVEPYMHTTFHFTDRQWKRHFPAGIELRFGLGTAAAALLVGSVTALAALDRAGVVDAVAFVTTMRQILHDTKPEGPEMPKGPVEEGLSTAWHAMTGL